MLQALGLSVSAERQQALAPEGGFLSVYSMWFKFPSGSQGSMKVPVHFDGAF